MNFHFTFADICLAAIAIALWLGLIFGFDWS